MRRDIYPLTVCYDRYQGTYSGAAFTAWNLDPCDVPEEIYSDDIDCMLFWQLNHIPCGKGPTVQDAIVDLVNQINEPLTGKV